jgi:hypothetical protein
MINTSGGYALFHFYYLTVSTYCLYSPLLDDVRCQIRDFLAIIVILSSCTISRNDDELQDSVMCNIFLCRFTEDSTTRFVLKIMVGCSSR